MVTTRRVRGHYPKPELSKSRFVTRRVVADFSTLPELVKHARSMDGATHVAGSGAETRIYFPRGDGGYEEATVWQKGNYWHALGPGARQRVRTLPRDAKPITQQGMRWASEARHSAPALRWSFDGVASGQKGEYRLGKMRNGWTVILNGHTSMGEWASPELAKNKAERYDADNSIVRDYAAIDNRGRTTAGPFKTYGDAKQAAGPAGSVKFVPGKRATQEKRRSAHHRRR